LVVFIRKGSMIKFPSEPLITTIIPTYQRPELLRRSILSVLLQSYPYIRICVCDNASGDETKTVVDQIMRVDNRVKYHCHHKNIGVFNNFNYGVQEVQTPFFSLFSDDDILTPLFYEQAIKGFEKFPAAMFVCLGTIVVDINNKFLNVSAMVDQTRFFGPGEGFEGIAKGFLPGTWTAILFRREVRDKIGLVDALAGPFADGGYVQHAAARFPFVVLPDIGAILMSHSGSGGKRLPPLDGTWLSWRKKMIQAIISDEKIPLFVRSRINEVIPRNFRKIAFYITIKSLTEGRLEFAKKVSIGLKECGYPLTSKLLQLLVWSYQWIPLTRPPLLVIKKIRRHFQEKIKYPGLNRQYGKHLDFIRRLDALMSAWEKKYAELDISTIKLELNQ